MVNSFALFFVDFIGYSLFNDWLIRFLLIHFLVSQLTYEPKKGSLLVSFWQITLLLLQDMFLYGRFGLGLIYVIPFFIVCRWLSVFFRKKILFMPYLVLMVALIFEIYGEKKLLLHKNIDLRSTIVIVLINLIAMAFYSFIKGMRGNRTYSFKRNE